MKRKIQYRQLGFIPEQKSGSIFKDQSKKQKNKKNYTPNII